MRWRSVHIVKQISTWPFMTTQGQPLSTVTQIQPSFPQKPLGRLKPDFIWSLHGRWGMKMCSNVSGHMTMPMYDEKLPKTLIFGTKGLMTLKLGIQHRVLEYYQFIQMMTLDWPWPFLWHGRICFLMLFLHGWKLIHHWVFMYFQLCFNSAYPQHAGERYRTIGPLFFLLVILLKFIPKGLFALAPTYEEMIKN